jgi:hypothetical protein
MSLIGTALALVGLAPLVRGERAEMLEHIKKTEAALALARQEAAMWRGRHHALLEASHICQHQAQLNRAMADMHYPQLLAQLNASSCGRRLSGCNMHMAEVQAMQALGVVTDDLPGVYRAA